MPQRMLDWKTKLSAFGNQIFALGGRKDGGYDIPLYTRLGTEFLILLIALMTYLSLLAGAGNFALENMAERWTSGLEKSMTIEIPAKDTAKAQASALVSALSTEKGIAAVKILDTADMGRILSPWLGNDTSILDDLPLPVLISIDIEERTPALVNSIKTKARNIAPDAVIDTHEDWLNDLIKLTNSLRATSLIIFALILLVTGIVVAGAIRSRMAIHQRELELLHLMGASDTYISAQFIRYVINQSLRGMGYGITVALLTLIGFMALAQKTGQSLPQIKIETYDWIVFLAVPVLLLSIGTLAARQTVFKVLKEMP